MKTISTIALIFVLGLLGWFGFGVPEKIATVNTVEKIKETDTKISDAERKCREIECKIEGDQYEIQNQLRYGSNND